MIFFFGFESKLRSTSPMPLVLRLFENSLFSFLLSVFFFFLKDMEIFFFFPFFKKIENLFFLKILSDDEDGVKVMKIYS